MKKVVIIFFIFLSSCDSRKYDTSEFQETEKDSLMHTTNNDSGMALVKESIDTNQSKMNTDTTTQTLNIDSLGKHPFVEIHGTAGKKLYATLSSNDPKANIRIEQIERPDSTFDGPFRANT